MRANGFAILASAALVFRHVLAAPAADSPIAPGPFEPTMGSLTNDVCPEWFRDARSGIWSHGGPQPEASFSQELGSQRREQRSEAARQAARQELTKSTPRGKGCTTELLRPTL